MGKESDLGPHVIAWLQANGFRDVYQEVDAWAGVADLVATAGPMLGVVEMKVALSWDLLSQACRWRNVAHQVWVAVPEGKRSDGRKMAFDVFEERGVGILVVHTEWSQVEVDLAARPAFNRKACVEHVRKYLHEEQKTFAAAGAHPARRRRRCPS